MTPVDFVVTLVLVAGFTAAVIATSAAQRREKRKRVATWAECVRGLGLSDIEPADDALTASSGSLRLGLSAYKNGESSGTRIRLWGPRLAPGLTLVAERSGFLASRSPREVELGDDVFDRAVSVQGPPALALALLDADVRQAVLSMIRGRLSVRGHPPLWASGELRDGVLCIDLPIQTPRLRRRPNADEPPPAGTVFLDGVYKLPQVLRAALDLAARLVQPADLPGRLAARLPKEPEARVRLRALVALLREFPDQPATQAALRAACQDENAEVRVQAATALGPEARAVLLGVAGGEGAEDATSARAVAALAATLDFQSARDLLASALRTRRLETAQACLGVLGGHGSEAVATLAKVLLVEKGALGAAAADALAATADAAAETPLLQALAQGPPEVRRAAAAALGQVGTKNAVLPLRAAESREPPLSAVARQAVAQIHARLAGAAHGQLSLADGEPGLLSLVDGETGRLSLADSKPTGPDAGKEGVRS